MSTDCKCEAQEQLEHREEKADTPCEQLTLWDYATLMEHDCYRRVKGRVRQKGWSDS